MMGSVPLGRVQLQIMQVLWDKREATAREITDAINVQEPIMHSTVQTMLRVLEDKKAVGHRRDGRTFIFYPLVPETDFKQTATQNLIERVFGGSASSLVAHLLSCQAVTKKEIDEIRKMIDRKDKP